MHVLHGKNILLGVTGGVAAYKAAELTRLLVKAGALPRVVLTEAGSRFVGIPTFQALSGQPVWMDLWDTRAANGMAHITLGREADLILVAPATADFMARLALGAADDLLSTLCLARDCPLLVAPAMNRQMWQHPATQRNAVQLQVDGVTLLGPGTGEQACGETGDGRMLEPEQLLACLGKSVRPQDFRGKKVVLTAGPTFEALDPVRGMTNLSTGRMGYALAEAFWQMGAEVVLVSGPVGLAAPYGVTHIDVISAEQMRDAVMAHLFGAQVFVAVAAVADYRPSETLTEKIKKAEQTMNILLTRNPDILAEVAALPERPFCVGFAAESQHLDKYALGKLERKNVDMVVGNLVQDGFGTADNLVTLYDKKGKYPLTRSDKQSLAREIAAAVAVRINADVTYGLNNRGNL